MTTLLFVQIYLIDENLMFQFIQYFDKFVRRYIFDETIIENYHFFLDLFTNEILLKIIIFDFKMKFEIINENNNFLIVNFDRDKCNK